METRCPMRLGSTPSPTASRIAREGVVRWDFDALPLTVETDTGLTAHPALVANAAVFADHIGAAPPGHGPLEVNPATVTSVGGTATVVDDAVNGAPFYVMAHVDGLVLREAVTGVRSPRIPAVE